MPTFDQPSTTYPGRPASSSAPTLAVGLATDVGPVRRHNEDSSRAAGTVFVVADGMGGHAAGAEQALTALAKACIDNDQFVVAEGEATFFSSNFGLQALLKTSRSGLALHPDGNEGLSVFKVSLPAVNRADLPPGRGFAIEKGRFELLQVALP